MQNEFKTIQARVHSVRSRIRAACQQAGRDPGDVRLLAVSKARGAGEIRALHELGQGAFGENYLSEALVKQAHLRDRALQWHYIGPVQSNKTRELAQAFDWVQSVDREKIIRRLDEQRPEHLPPLNICLQVNFDREPHKAGCDIEDLPALARQVEFCSRLALRGLMVIPAPRAEYGGQLAVFEAAAGLYRELEAQYRRVDTFSAGMSGDLEAAIAAGSTLVRVGTALFGERD